MIYKDTVFILGAGASWHYGYPTGEELIEAVKDALEKLWRYTLRGCNDSSYRKFTPDFILKVQAEGIEQKWNIVHKNLHDLRTRITLSNPLVIDYFLSKNFSLKDYGNLAISLSIFQAMQGMPNFLLKEPVSLKEPISSKEPVSSKEPMNSSEKRSLLRDGWIRHLVHKLTVGCEVSSDLLKNRVRFITFNYDTSLENRLRGALSQYDFFTAADVETFLNNDRVKHIYGALEFGYVTLPPKNVSPG